MVRISTIGTFEYVLFWETRICLNTSRSGRTSSRCRNQIVIIGNISVMKKKCMATLVNIIVSQLEYIKDNLMAKDFFDAHEEIFERKSSQLYLRKKCIMMKGVIFKIIYWNLINCTRRKRMYVNFCFLYLNCITRLLW